MITDSPAIIAAVILLIVVVWWVGTHEKVKEA